MLEAGGISWLVFIDFKFIPVVPAQSLRTVGKPEIPEVILKNSRNVIVNPLVLPYVFKGYIVVSEREFTGLGVYYEVIMNQDEDQDPSLIADMDDRPLHVSETVPVVRETVNKYTKMYTTNTYRA